MTKNRSNACVLIVGAGRGIGQAIANAFASEGAQLMLVARTVKQLEETQEACRAEAASVTIARGDVSKATDVRQLVLRAEEQFDQIDVLINAAGVHGAINPTHQCNPAEWLRAVEVNLYGSFLLCNMFVPGMLRRKSGRIIMFAGGGATSPRPGFSAYAASKAGVVRFVETLSEEVQPHVQVNAIAPGLVDTSLLDDVLSAGPDAGPDYQEVLEVRKGKRESVAPELVAELAVFLGFTASTALTGRLISAPHDPWREWTRGNMPEPELYRLRRLDPHTLEPFRMLRP